MKKYAQDLKTSQDPISLSDFLDTFNKNMPANFPRATNALLQKFKDTHAALFKKGESWSLDLHRKKLIDWLPRK